MILRRGAALLVALGLAACERGVRADDPRLRWEGRTDRDAHAVRFAWPRTAVHLRYRGSRVHARITDHAYADRIPDHDVLGVQVDDGPVQRLALAEGTHEYTLAQGADGETHTLRVVKLTEAEAGTVTLRTVRIDGTGLLLAAPPAPTRRMLAIGDSITAGYGAAGADARCHYDVRWADADTTFVSRAAATLHADLQVLAWSGRGVWRNLNAEDRETLPVLFSRTIPTEPASRWDPSRWVPDDVVFNVGTNDVMRAGFDDGRFERALDAFVGRVMALAPRARVVLTVGPLLHDDVPASGSRSRQRVLAAHARVAARHGATLLTFGAASNAEGSGCDHHPGAATHARMAAALVNALRAQ